MLIFLQKALKIFSYVFLIFDFYFLVRLRQNYIYNTDIKSFSKNLNFYIFGVSEFYYLFLYLQNNSTTAIRIVQPFFCCNLILASSYKRSENSYIFILFIYKFRMPLNTKNKFLSLIIYSLYYSVPRFCTRRKHRR